MGQIHVSSIYIITESLEEPVNGLETNVSILASSLFGIQVNTYLLNSARAIISCSSFSLASLDLQLKLLTTIEKAISRPDTDVTYPA